MIDKLFFGYSAAKRYKTDKNGPAAAQVEEKNEQAFEAVEVAPWDEQVQKPEKQGCEHQNPEDKPKF